MMRDFVMRHKVGAATIVAALVVAVFSIYTVPLNPPLGDCFGGVLSQDPLICYVLEQADRQDVIDVETVYDADGVLYFSLKQDDELSSNVYEFFEAKAVEFYDRWPDDLPRWPDESTDLSECLERFDPRECSLGMNLGLMYLPRSMVYNDMRFFIGGDAARRSTPGWASWRQLWPATTSGASDASTTPATLDVSDVDMTNLPVHYACPDKLYGHRDDICSRDQNVALSILDTHSPNGTDRNKYIEYADPPEDPAQVIALKKIIDPCYGISWGVCEWTRTVTFVQGDTTTYVDRTVKQAASVTKPDYDDIVLIPAKYGPGELMRWVEILNRFALSTGNTIGLYEATIDDNKQDKEFEVVFTSAGPGPARMTEDGRHDLSTVRTIILVAGFDAQRIAAALPALLPLLGIPTDAVGLVLEYELLSSIEHYGMRSGGPSLEGIEHLQSAYEWTALERFAGMFGVSVRVLIGSTGVGAVLVAGGIVALVLRLRRRRAPG